MVRDAAAAGQRRLAIPDNAIVTALARDAAKSLGVALVAGSPSHAGTQKEQNANPAICIGSDHGGYEMKGALIEWLQGKGLTVIDLGTDSPKSCDYPDFAYAVAATVASNRAGKGIMIDGVGVGSAIACNKVPGIRAACGYTEFAAWNARAHNDANVLTLGSRTMGIEVVKRIVTVFLESEFEGGRHGKRVDKMIDIESRFLRK